MTQLYISHSSNYTQSNQLYEYHNTLDNLKKRLPSWQLEVKDARSTTKMKPLSINTASGTVGTKSGCSEFIITVFNQPLYFGCVFVMFCKVLRYVFMGRGFCSWEELFNWKWRTSGGWKLKLRCVLLLSHWCKCVKS